MRNFFTILFLLCFICNGFSQNEIYKFKHLTTSEGLSQSTVMSIIQDDLGQIWIGTRDGLNKYDSSEFTVYRHDKTNPLSISNNDVNTVIQDSNGFIWIGTALGLNKYDPKKDCFKAYFKGKNALIDNIVSKIKELSNKELWVGTPSGLSIYNNKDSFLSLLKGQHILSIFETQNKEVFVGTKNGLLQLIEKRANQYKFKKIKGTESFSIQDIIQSPNGNLLLGTKTKGILEYNIHKQGFKPYFEGDFLNKKNNNVRQLLFDDRGHLWIGTINGIQIADKAKNKRVFRSNINDNEGISDNFIKTLFKDKKGTIWIGSYNGGIDLWDKSNVNFLKVIQKPGNLGLGFKVVSSIAHHRNNIFFATEGGGISIFNINDKTFEYINTSNTPALTSDNIKSLYKTKDNTLWIGTFEDAFVVYNIETKSFSTTFLHQKLLSYLKGVGVYVIKQGRNGEMLLGTIGKGLIRYNSSDKSFKTVDTSTKPYGLLNDIIRAVMVDAQNNIWVSTMRGMSVIDSNGKIKHYFNYREGNKESLVNTIFEDAKGGIWAGTESEGLFKFVNNDFKSIDLRIKNTNRISGVKSIIEDDKGLFWISTVNQGILHYNPSKNNVVANYTQKEGLVSNQYNNNTSLRIGSTNYFFGGPSGVVYFNSNKLVKNDYSPQVIITDFKIKNKSISVNDTSAILSNTITFTKEIELSYDQGNFNISYSIPNFINSSSNRYIYRLKGLEKEWNETSQNSVSYTIQNPGNYVFEVKGINNDGVYNKVPSVLKIRVNPAPWRSWWAFLIYGVLIFAALKYLLNILKSKSKLKNQLDLEQLQAEQIKEANKNKLEFFTNISHEFRTPLTLILGPLHQILEDYRGSNLMYKKLKVVESNANHLLHLINRLMDFRKLESNFIKLEAAEGNIVKFLKEIYQL